MGSALLFALWTAWLLVVLCLLGWKRGAPALLAFVAFGIVVLVAHSQAWRPYLMGWLGAYALVSGYGVLDTRYREIRHSARDGIASNGPGRTSMRRVLLPVISIGGLLWLWIDGGAAYWGYLAVALLAIVGAVLVFWSGRRVLAIYRARVQRQIDQACAAERQKLVAEHEETVRGRDMRLEAATARLREAQRRCQQQASLHQVAEQRNREVHSTLLARNSQIEQLSRELETCRAEAQAQQEREARRRGAERELVSDIFCCTACRSMWLITARPGGGDVRRPAGEGCDVCSGPAGVMRPPLPLAGSGYRPATAPVTAVPAHQPQTTRQKPSAARADDRTMIGVGIAVDLAALDSKATADDLAHWAAGLLWGDVNQAFPAEYCRILSSIADGLDAIPDDIARGVAWCARAAGAPRIIADLLGAVARFAIESHVAPLHTLAQEIRLIGTARCAAEGADHLASCQCARGLVQDLSAQAAADALDSLLAPAIARLEAIEMPPPHPAPPVPPSPPADPMPPPIGPASPSPFSPF